MLSPHEVGDKVIPTGTFVLAGLASANRDQDSDMPRQCQCRPSHLRESDVSAH